MHWLISMSLSNFDIISIVAIFTSVCCTVVLYQFVYKISHIIKRLEKKTVELIKLHGETIDRVENNRRQLRKPEKISFMEGDMDLVANNKRATFKAIYYPKKIKK